MSLIKFLSCTGICASLEGEKVRDGNGMLGITLPLLHCTTKEGAAHVNVTCHVCPNEEKKLWEQA